MGVASLSKDPTIRIYNKKKTYNEWMFIYNPMMDVQNVLLRGPYQPTTIGGAQIGTPASQMNGQQQGAFGQQQNGQQQNVSASNKTASDNSRTVLDSSPTRPNPPVAATSLSSRISNNRQLSAGSRQLSDQFHVILRWP